MKGKILFVLGMIILLMAGCAKKEKKAEKQIAPEQKVEKAEKGGDIVPKVAFFTGSVKITSRATSKETPVRLGMKLGADHIVKTDAESRVEIRLGGSDNMILVNESSVMAVNTIIKQDLHETKVDMSVGKIFVDIKKLTRKREEFTVETPTAVAAIRGTGFEVEVEKESGATDVSVVEGEVELRDNQNQGSVHVKPAHKARVERGRKPSKPRRMRKREVDKVKKWVGRKTMNRVFKRMKPETRKLLGVKGSDLLEKGAGDLVKGKGLKQVKKDMKMEASKKIDKTMEKARDARDKKVRQVKKDIKKSVDKKVTQPAKRVQRGAQKKADGAAKRAGRGVKKSGAKKKADDAEKKAKDKLKL